MSLSTYRAIWQQAGRIAERPKRRALFRYLARAHQRHQAVRWAKTTTAQLAFADIYPLRKENQNEHT